jgi:hypothetical protein
MSSNRQILARPSGPSRSIQVNQKTQRCRDDIRFCAQQPTLDTPDLSRPNSIRPTAPSNSRTYNSELSSDETLSKKTLSPTLTMKSCWLPGILLV